MDLFDCFGVTNHPSECLTDMVSFQSGSCSNWVISQVVQLSNIPAFIKLGYIQNLIASICKPFQRAVNFSPQLLGYYQLAFYR
jgi:hypothetical protein